MADGGIIETLKILIQADDKGLESGVTNAVKKASFSLKLKNLMCNSLLYSIINSLTNMRLNYINKDKIKSNVLNNLYS